MQVVKPIIFNSFEFDRDSVATYYDENGVLVSAPIDELRYGYNPNTLEFIGPIFEDEATNIIPYANDFADWIPGAGTAIGIESPAYNPDATTTSQYSQPGSAPFAISKQMGSVSSGARCFSVFVKTKSLGDGGATSITLRISGTGYLVRARYNTNFASPSVISSLGSITTEIQKINNGWLRLSISATLPFSSDPYFAVILGDNDVNDGLEGDGTHYLWGAQVEEGRFPTSFIYTTGMATTRASDEQVITPPSVIDSNIPASDNPEYVAGTSYSIGDTVMVLGINNRNYRSLADTNIGNFPPNNPDKWLDIGAINRWRMFDMDVGADLQSTLSGDINFTLSLDEKVKDVCLFNIEGQSVNLKMYSGGEVVFDQTVDLVLPVSESSYWAFYFENRRRVKDVAFVDLPPVTYSSIEITIDGGGSSTALGKCIVGYGEYLGFAEYGTTSIGIVDYSTKERDQFGNYFVQERRYAGTMSLKPVVEPGNETRTRDILAECRAISSAYIVEAINGEQILTLGFFKDFDVLFSTPANSYLSINLEAI